MESYKPLIDDWEAFRESVEKPALSTVRKNHLKASDDFEEQLRQRFDEVEQADWNPDIFRLRGEKLPGKSMLHWFGEYYVQEESAAIPVEALDPQKGDRILDMCAAPGGKTTQIASEIGNSGSIVANDQSSKRLQSLHANVYRTGAASVAVTNYDGRNLPEGGKYDRILLDAPCSGEGDRARRNFEIADEDEKESLSELQKQLGEKAARLLEDDGVMVYSTCTINPRENEEVVRYLVENTGLELEDIELDLPHRSGAREFEGMEYGEELSKTVRVYPHHLESGVIYVARFVNSGSSSDRVKRKSSGDFLEEDSDGTFESSISSSSGSRVEEAWNYLKERFGVEREELSGYRLKERSGDIWILSRDLDTDLEAETEGFRFIRVTGRGLKPTTYALQFLGDRISRNVVELEKRELLKLLRREEMIDAELEDEGYVTLKYGERIVGCGMYRDGVVSSRVPKGRGKELAGIIG